ncbi:hypothetical protein BP00DRAFT_461797 [Aspergillus indologenus CBS 114.80]|uniref:Protein kinase domain-containing protein n=1 Tax=Aspergillus indologenus CBS 114.80 TaxID=1450541 RepID=A0A2V5IAA0_9EURO|nr:hypothetical protein BP00DRAFT_461797 [Aspergillus indologenus CBS 114.80]
MVPILQLILIIITRIQYLFCITSLPLVMSQPEVAEHPVTHPAPFQLTVAGFGEKKDWETYHTYLPINPEPKFALAHQRFKLDISGFGHRAEQGALQAVWVGLMVKDTEGLMETEYLILIDVPTQEPTASAPQNPIVQHCIELYVNQRISELGSLLGSLFLPPVLEEMGPRPDNLESLLARSHLCYRLQPGADDDAVTFEPWATPILRGEIDWTSEILGDILQKVPVFAHSDIESFREIKRRKIYEVVINGKTLIFKFPHVTETLAREVNILRKMADREPGVRVPKVAGIIGVNTSQPGILMTLVPSGRDLSVVLESDPDISRAERQKWYDQVSEMVRILHRNGCVWGDVKDANILIDENRDAWLIDFEGSRTPDWVDEDLKGTEAGDLQGLKKLHEVLQLEAEEGIGLQMLRKLCSSFLNMCAFLMNSVLRFLDHIPGICLGILVLPFG